MTTMEPPAKRRRRDSPASREHNDDNNDELASHPQEISVRRDPNIQLALKRANANHKLQATMAHIIEKYSRDFEGVGDEIDMETGEIIVDNGHISNMRDEGDVGGIWSSHIMGGDGEGGDDDDEGILLEDLPDDYFVDDDDDDNNINRPQHSNRRDRPGESSNQTVEPQTSRTLSTIPDSQSSFASLPPQSSTPSVPPILDSTPYGFGAGPGSFGPWGMSPSFMMQTWGRDDIPPYIMMPPSQPLPGLEGGRYNFPAQNEYTSIWGRFRGRKTRKVGTMRGVRKSTPSVSEEHAASHQVNQGYDTFTDIPQHKNAEGPPQDENEDNENIVHISDGDDDLGIPDAHPPSSEAGPVQKSNQVSILAHKPEKPPESVLENTSGNILKRTVAKTGKRPRGRPRLVRVDDQVKPQDEAPEHSAKEEAQRASQVLSIELPRIDANIRDQYMHVEDAPEVAYNGEESNGLDVADKMIAGKVIPDSQDTATVFNSSAPQVSSQPELHTHRPAKSSHDVPVSLELSDDEAPLLLSKLGPPKRKRSVSRAINKLSPCEEVVEQESLNGDTGCGLDGYQIGTLGSSEAEQERHEMVVETAVDDDQSAETRLFKSAFSVDAATEDSIPVPTSAQPQDSQSTEYTARSSGHDQQPAVVKKRGRGRPRSRFPQEAKLDDKAIPSTTDDKQSMGMETPRLRSSSRNMPQPDKQASHGPAGRSARRTPGETPAENSMDEPTDKATDNATDRSSDRSLHKLPTLSIDQISTDSSSALSHPTEIPSSLSLDYQLPPLPPNPSTTPKRSRNRTTRPTGTPSSNPHTPRHTAIRTSHAPSSRRSLLSFVEDDSDPDELVQLAPPGSGSKSARTVTHRIWRSTQLTTEVQRTPSRKQGVSKDASGDTIKTPGGTLRTCGVDGYNCGRDFCFVCL